MRTDFAAWEISSGRTEVTGSLAAPGYVDRGTRGSRGAECAVSASEKREVPEYSDASAHSAMGDVGTSRQRRGHERATEVRRGTQGSATTAPPTIVTRTSSVRAGVGDDGSDNTTAPEHGDKSDK